VLARLFLLFTVVPLAELAILVWIAQRTSWLVALAMVVLPAALGAWLARRQGLRCWRAVHEQTARGELPADSLLDGLLILIAGALLITPGLLTDTAGFLLLTPPFRRLVRRWLVRRIQSRIFFSVPSDGPGPASQSKVLDARVIDVESRPPDKS
jgi:UPF0716 protein FxsA